jgi:hypothetical protein
MMTFSTPSELTLLNYEKPPMTTQKTNTILSCRWVLASCPATGEQVIGATQSTHLILGLQAVWWACPACHGWHVTSREENNQQPNPSLTK